MARKARLSLVSTAGLFAIVATILVPATARAADAKKAADDFAELMASGVENPDRLTSEAPPASFRAMAGGYYRVLVKRNTSDGAAASDRDLNCDDSIKKLTGSSKIGDIITDRTSDVGVSLEFPISVASNEPTKAELNLFRINKTSSKCRIEQSYFALRAKDEAFETPLMPLPMNPGADARAIEVKFRPWIAQSSNPARMSALWKGVGAFAKFLGPIGALGSMLLDSKKEDPYALRAQAKASFFEATGLDPATDKLVEGTKQEFNRKLRILPSADLTTPMNRVTANWVLAGRNKADIAIGYTIDVDHVASRIIGKTFRKVEDIELAELIDQESPTSGVPWREITPSLSNLGKQNTPAAFGAACQPALDDLQRLGLSEPDRVLLIYAVGRSQHQFTGADFNGIVCIGNRSAKAALRRFGIELPDNPVINSPAETLRSASTIANAFRFPANLGSAAAQPRLDGIVKQPVSIKAGNLLRVSDGKPFGDTTMEADTFLARFKLMNYFSQTSCIVTQWSDAAMPQGSGLTSPQQPAAFLAKRGDDGTILMVFAGLSSKVSSLANLPPSLSSIYVTDGKDINDQVIADVRAKMQAMPEADCARTGVFLPFFAPPPTPAAPTIP